MKAEFIPFDEKMKKTTDVLVRDLAAVRAGRANPAVLDRVSIDYFGVATPIHQVGAISSPEPRMLMIQPWDQSVLGQIEKAIQASDIGINPQNDGKVIRLVFPQLNEERRKELIKQVSKMAEDSKVAIRNIRRDAIDKFKAMKKGGEMTEDELKDAEKQMQTMTDKYVKEIDGIAEKKSKELAEV